jgi:hypothetical protein
MSLIFVGLPIAAQIWTLAQPIVREKAGGLTRSLGGEAWSYYSLGLASVGMALNGCRSTISIFANAVITDRVLRYLDNEPRRFSQNLSRGASSYPKLALSVLFKTLSTTIGLILLVAPGLVLLTRWSVAGPALIAERRGVRGSLERSAKLTEGRRWLILGLLLGYVICSWLVQIAAADVLMSFAGFLTARGLFLTLHMIAFALIDSALWSFGVCLLAALYHELRRTAAATTPQAVAAAFD